MKKIIVIPLLLSVCLYSNTSTAKNYADCLMKAYPTQIQSVSNNQIKFRNGSVLLFGTVSNLPFTKKLNNASVADQLSEVYALDFHIPKQYEDAGRIRNDDFFKNMYGSSESEVRKNMISVPWKPAKSSVQFTRVNGAARQLEKVGNEIALRPDLSAYVAKSLGSLNYRPIAGTNRMSAHSFGVAIDFQLPETLHKYWRWDGCKSEDVICPYPKQLS